MDSTGYELALPLIVAAFFGFCVMLGLFTPTLFFFIVGFTICIASASLAVLGGDIDTKSLSTMDYTIGDIYTVSAIGFGFGLLIFACGAITNRLRSLGGTTIIQNEKLAPLMDNDMPTSEPPKNTALLLDVVREHVRFLVDPLAGSSLIESPMPVLLRVVAALAGAFALHASIGLYPYLFNAEKIVRDFSMSGFFLSSSVSIVWIVFSGLLYARYDRSADFAHIFRSSFLFNVLIYVTGKLAHLLVVTVFS